MNNCKFCFFGVSKVLTSALLDEKGFGIKLSLIESNVTPSLELVQEITALYQRQMYLQRRQNLKFP